MKNRTLPRSWWAGVGLAVLALAAVSVAGQESATPAPAPVAAKPVAASQSRPVQLSYGVPDVLKLSQARVDDTVIVAFIKNSGTIYNLTSPEIVYLHEQGVSDQVVAAMLDQRAKVQETAAKAAAHTAPPVSSPPANTAQYAPTYAQPSTTYVETAPAYAPSSTYVIPYPYATDAYYGYRPYSHYGPYYGGYYGYSYPGVSLSFGFGNYYHGGGYHGGGYYGGGFHGGGPVGFHGGGFGGPHGAGFSGGGAHGGGHH